MDDKFHTELADLFAGEDKALRSDGEVFVATVQRKLEHRVWVRRLLLGGVTLAGGVIALTQAPDLLARFGEIIGSSEALFGGAAKEVTGLPGHIGVMLFVAVVSVLAVFSTDRV